MMRMRLLLVLHKAPYVCGESKAFRLGVLWNCVVSLGLGNLNSDGLSSVAISSSFDLGVDSPSSWEAERMSKYDCFCRGIKVPVPLLRVVVVGATGSSYR